MSFASKVHEEQHRFTLEGQQYLLQIHTTKFIGYNLITSVRCSRRIPDTVDGYVYLNTRDFCMTLRTDYAGRITRQMIERHINAVKENLENIKHQALAFYS